MSAAAQAAGRPWPEKRPCAIIIALRNDGLVFVFQRRGKRADEVEQTVAAGRYMRAVLDVAIGPEALGGDVVPLIEERVEGFEYERFVLG